MPSRTVDEDLTRLLRETNFFDEQNVQNLKLEPPTYQPLRLQFTRKSKKILTDAANELTTRRKRRKRGKSNNVCTSREENKENQAAPRKGSDESFLQEWHDDEVEIADYRSSDDSQDEQLQEWYKDLKGNKRRNINCPPANDNARNIGPVIRHESSSEEKSWLQTDIGDTYLLDMLAKYSADANPHEIVFDDLMDPRRWIERTHLIAEDVMLVKKHRIFTILRQNRPRNLLAHLRLGYCVTHQPGRPSCQQEGRTCALQCHICGVCCHMYSCTCRLVKRFQWCSHIHAAVLCGGNKFKNDQQVYLHLSSRYTQLSHLRATCFDMANDVKPVENSENAFVVIGWTTEWTPFSVFRSSQMVVCHICPQYKRCPECSTCRHQYLCACAEFMVEKRLCEHCHVVAIFLSQNRVSTLKKREFRYLSDVSDDTDEEADPKRDTSSDMLPLRRVFAHHEKSYSIPFRRIKVGSMNDQLVYCVQRCDPDRRFVVHTQNRVLCTCLAACTGCRMCSHYLTCNCGKGDAELCKHTHAVRRFMVKSYTPADRTIESALGKAVRQALGDFYGGCDLTESNCDSSLVTEENIMAVVENLKLVMESDVAIESKNADEPSVACEDSTKSSVFNVEPVLEEVSQVHDSKDESRGKILSDGDSCLIPSDDTFENDHRSSEPVHKMNDIGITAEGFGVFPAELIKLNSVARNSTLLCCLSEPVLEKSSDDNFDVNILAAIDELNVPSSDFAEKSGSTLKSDLKKGFPETGKVASLEGDLDFERQLQPVRKTHFVGASDFETTVVVEKESPAETQQCNHSNARDSATDTSVGNDQNVGGKLDMSAVANGAMISDGSWNNWQLDPVLRNSNDDVDTSNASEDGAAAGIKCSNSSDVNSQPAESNLICPDDNESGVGEKDENEASPPFDWSSVKTLRSFYDLLFEPAIQVRYKSDAPTREDGCPKVLAESSRCIVTVGDCAKESPPRIDPVILRKLFRHAETTEKDISCVSKETSKLTFVGKNLEACSVEDRCPDLDPVLPENTLRCFGVGEDGTNEILSETCESSLVARHSELSKTGGRLANSERDQFPLEIPSCLSDTDEKVERRVLAKAGAPSVVHKTEIVKENCTAGGALNADPVLFNFERTFDGFNADKEEDKLVPKEKSESTNFGRFFKQKSLDLMKKLNFVKNYKKPQKDEASLLRFLGYNKSWTRSRRQRELAVLQSISDDLSMTDSIYENLDFR